MYIVGKTIQSNILNKIEDIVEGEYKVANYVISHEYNDSLLLYNLLTGALINYNSEIHTTEFLIKEYFLILKDEKEYELIKKANLINRSIENTPKSNIRGYTILPTTACNAKCHYCFEQGCKKETMSYDTADKIVNLYTKLEASPVEISWFGGEPLLGKDIMLYISDKIAKRDIKYSSTIISNGFLWNNFSEDEILNRLRIKHVQFTLDGMNEVHDNIKCIDNCFEQTIINMKYLLDLKINISVRLNVYEENLEELKKVVDFLAIRFKDYKNFRVYAHYIFKDWDGDGVKMADNFIELDTLIHNKFKNMVNRQNIKIMRKNSCMADAFYPGQLVILPNGEFIRCHNMTTSPSIGNIDGEPDMKNLYYRELREDIEECKNCSFYPTCQELKYCKSVIPCTPGYRKYKEYLTRRQIEELYRTNEKTKNPEKRRRLELIKF